MTIMSIAGHVSRQHYSRIRTGAKRAALEAIATVFEPGVHQNVHQVLGVDLGGSAKLL
jgi:hypothetical protein